MKLKLKMPMKILATIKKCLILVIIQPTPSIMMISDKLVVCKMKEKKSRVVGLKPKMYSYLINDNSEHKKVIRVNGKCCCDKKAY